MKNRYSLMSNGEVLERYVKKDWAVHSAECFATLYSCMVYVVDESTGEVVAMKDPLSLSQ